MLTKFRKALLALAMVIAIFAVFVFILNATIFKFDLFRNPLADTQKLTTILPVLQQLHVDEYRNQDWCKNIYYDRGAFSDYKGTADTCNLFSTQPQSFDLTAQLDFTTISQVISETGISVMWTSAEFTNSGEIIYAEFSLDCGFCRTRYVYEPNYGNLISQGSEIRYTRITNEWYRVDEDWN